MDDPESSAGNLSTNGEQLKAFNGCNGSSWGQSSLPICDTEKHERCDGPSVELRWHNQPAGAVKCVESHINPHLRVYDKKY
jgi:hypothetical protein